MAIPIWLTCLVALLLGAPGFSAAQDADQARRAALDRLSDRLESGDVAGRFVERTPGAFAFVPEAPDLPALPVLNPDDIGPASVGPRLTVRATYDPTSEGIRVTGYGLAVRAAALESVTPGPLAARAATASQVERALAAFQGRISRALRPSGVRELATDRAEAIAPEDDPMIASAERQAERELDAAYRDAVARGDDEQRRAAVRAIAGVRQELKAIYGTYDNYPPWSYERIFANSRSVVALAEPGQHRQALCSGVLITPDLVLTAGHCFQRHHPEDLQVWFGFVETADGALPPPMGFRITELVAPPSEEHEEFLERAAQERFDAEVPDYAIVRFGADDETGLPAEVTPQCLRAGHISRGRSIYVVGYPKGTREMVHDNGRVYLPFRLRPRELEALKKEIEVDFAVLEDADRLRLLDEFVASYVERAQGTGTVFELHDTRFGGQPKVGIVADTFQGNSGSPVFDRDNHCIAGILTGGAPDIGQRLGASWQFHETVLPMPAILASLGRTEPTAALLEPGVLIIP